MSELCEVCGTDYSVKIFIKPKSKFDGMYMCRKHRNEIKNNGYIRDKRKPVLPKKMRKCEVCESIDDVIYHKERYICRRHYSQIRLYGETLKRTKYDKNEIVIYEDFAEIVLYNKDHLEVTRAIIDLDDVERVKCYKWAYDSLHNYVTTTVKGEHMGLHQLVMNTKGLNKNIVVDHIDRNGLNNRKSNLRVADKSINAINTDLRANNKSGVTGVSFSKRHNLWRSYISYDKKRIELGWYSNKDEAIVSRLNAEAEYYPDYPPQEHLFKKYNIGAGDNVG